MKFKTGDKVKFLNKVGGGYVTQVLDNAMVRIISDGGLEYPVPEKELILIDPKSSIERYFDEDYDVSMPSKDELKVRHKKFAKQELKSKGDLPEAYEVDREIEKREKEANRISGPVKLIDNADGDRIEQGVYLAYIPADQEKLKTSNLIISFVNNTEYTIVVNSYLRKSTREYHGLDLNTIAPFTRLNLCEIKREELVNWIVGTHQVLFSTSTTKVVPNPVNIDINLKVTYFDINDNYRTSNVMYERAFMVLLNDIYYNEKINIPKEEKSKDVLITEEKAKQAIAPVAPQLIDRHKTGKGKAEVDLHISALRDDFSNMKNFEILREQTEYFRSALESAIENHYKEVVFIHGIGNGTLKGTITKILKDEYPDIWFHDASFAKYGNGAIELFLTEL